MPRGHEEAASDERRHEDRDAPDESRRLDKAPLQRGEVRQRTPIDGGQAHRWNGREAGRGDPAGTAAEGMEARGYLTEMEMAAQFVKVIPGQ